jgi:hypothetical protein
MIALSAACMICQNAMTPPEAIQPEAQSAAGPSQSNVANKKWHLQFVARCQESFFSNKVAYWSTQ